MKKTLKDFLLEREYRYIDDNHLIEMSNLSKKDTKLPAVIYVSDYQGVKHGPRIKVNRGYGNKWQNDSFSITIDDHPRVIGNSGEMKNSDIEHIKDWILLNKKILLDMWNEKISIVEFVKLMRYL